jgi:hypothetical protein
MKKMFQISAIMLSVLVSLWVVSSAYATGETPTYGSITVHKFHDLNSNGVQDEGEMDVEGWLIRIYDYNNGWFIAAEGYTGTGGIVTFSELAANTYGVWEELRECWEPTTAGNYKLDGFMVAAWTGLGINVPIEFGNVYICTGGGDQGCTPGYWKNHLDSWTLDPTQDFDTTFGVDFFTADISLLEAVNLGGGHVNKVARHGVAALLNALHPDVNYPLTAQEVIALVREGDGDTLVDNNELGCLLD